jgi:hypothetical protein
MTCVKVFCTRLHVVEASGAIAWRSAIRGRTLSGIWAIVMRSPTPSSSVGWAWPQVRPVRRPRSCSGLTSWITVALGAYRGAGGRSETQHGRGSSRTGHGFVRRALARRATRRLRVCALCRAPVGAREREGYTGSRWHHMPLCCGPDSERL